MRRSPASPGDARAVLAAFLSFLFPGLGQLYNRQALLGWALAAPVLLLAALGGLAFALSASGTLSRLVDVRFLAGLIVLDLALLGWRLVAIVQAHGRRERFGASWTWSATALLVVLTLAMHGLSGLYALKTIDTLTTIGADHPGGPTGPGPRNEPGGLPGFELPGPSDHPDPQTGQRVNVLLVGVDALPQRGTQLTDTMMVVSLDPAGGRSAMISIPRDLYGAPLPDGRIWAAKLNSLMARTNLDPTQFPLGGVGTLKATVGNLLGVEIHYFAAINLLGFKQAIDAIGGVEIQVQRAINDPTYVDEFDNRTGFYLQPGTHYMDGHTALAYVRSRKGIGDNDFTRAARQQQLLTAVRQKLTAQNLLLTLPALLDATKLLISTDIPTDRMAILARAVQDADMSELQRVVIEPPLVVPDNDPASGYILRFDPAELRALGQRLMGDGADSGAAGG